MHASQWYQRPKFVETIQLEVAEAASIAVVVVDEGKGQTMDAFILEHRRACYRASPTDCNVAALKKVQKMVTKAFKKNASSPQLSCCARRAAIRTRRHRLRCIDC